jgi:hypothetical protein
MEANKALLAEKARIQRALLELGYFAYRIRFQPCGSGASLEIEARPGSVADEEIILRDSCA